MPRLPADAFERFVALGAGRSYSKLAAAVGVSKRSIVARASRESWQERLGQIETEAKRRTEERAVEDVLAIDEKHLRMARAIQARALEALKNSPLGNGTAAVRALDVAIKIERAILGRGKESPAAATHARLCQAASLIPPELVEAACEALRRAEQAKAKPAIPEPLVPPVLAPRVFGEN